MIIHNPVAQAPLSDYFLECVTYKNLRSTHCGSDEQLKLQTIIP